MKMALKNSSAFFWLSLLTCVCYFIVFIAPNRVGAKNIEMVAVFEPDESVPLPYVFDMIAPADSVKQALINFAFYEYYFYGFPYFAVSAVSLLPLVPLGLINDISLVMVVLRQVISVLPMLMTVLLLVYMTTGFKSYKSLVLTLLLLSIPAVVRNNFWWHPDSMVTLLSVLVIYFLNKDELRFGSNFYIAAVMCGFSAGTKGIGFYFFLTIAVYLLLGFFIKKLSLWKLFLMGLGFIACMFAAYLFANPTLVYSGVRKDYFALMERQSVELYSGYWVLYPKGFLISLPDLTGYFGNGLFLLLALFACVHGIVKDKNRLLNIIIITWAIPLSVLVFWITNFKFQYWIPVALPLFSTMMAYLPDEVPDFRSLLKSPFSKNIGIISQIVFSLAIVLQLSAFTVSDVQRYFSYLNKTQDKPALQFYDLAVDVLKPLPDTGIFVYRDVRMYFPRTANWTTEAVFKPLDYDYIRSRDFEVLMVMQQRIYDYLTPGVQGINPESFARSQLFYRDADTGDIEGYQLVFRNHFGLVFVRDDIYQEYFSQK
ncbi:MAG: hypothetical protein IPP66_22490 [Anaerolineales bacterium]|nr:hypothetical protein [Anaerolineales bacterium]